MTPMKPDPRIKKVWYIRLLCMTVPPLWISFYFSASRNLLWWLFTAAWVLSYLYLYIFYYPIKFRKLSYFRSKTCLLVHCGVIYTRVKAVPFTSMQYLSVVSTPLERLFGVCSLFIFSAGSMVYLPGLTPSSAEQLEKHLTPKDGGAPFA